MRIKILVLMVSFVVMLTAGKAQQEWTLTDCINYAHTHNLQIKRQELQAKISEEDYLAAKMRILPNLNASAGRGYGFGRKSDPQTLEFSNENTINDSYGIYAGVDLFRGLQTLNGIKTNQNLMLARIQNVEKEKVNITLQIAQAYLRILFSEEILEVSKNQREVTALQVVRTGKLVEAGNTARGDLLEIKAQLAAEDLNVTTSQNDKNVSYLNLIQLLDFDSVGGFKIFTPDSIEPDINLEVTEVYDVFAEAIAFLPHVKSSEYNLMANQNYLKQQKGMLSPRLSLSGAWETAYSSYAEDNYGFNYGDQLDLNSNKSFRVSLNIPIFNRWQVQNSINTAKIQVLDAETQLDQTKQQLLKEIQQAYNDAISARDKFKSAFEAVTSYQESFGYTEQKFNVGMVNSVEYNIAKNNFIKAQSELSKSKFEYIFSIKILDFYRGVPITL